MENTAYLKYIIFFITLFLVVPVGGLLGVASKKIEKLLIFLSVFFSCRTNETINFFSHELYRGSSRGFEISLVDLVGMSLFFVVLFRKKVTLFPPGSFLYFLYFSFSALSIINSANVLFSSFELWKMLRMYFYFWTIYNLIQNEEDFQVVIKSVYFIIFYIFAIVLFDKYIGGRYQARGPFPHQNSLVMYLIFFGGIITSRVVNFKPEFKTLVATVCIFLGVIFTYSRAGMFIYGVMVSGIFGIGLLEKVSARKVISMIFVFLAGLLVLLKSGDTIIDRFVSAPKESANTRVYMAKAAVNMANDKVLGVGLNNWGIKVNKPYGYSSHSPRYHEDGFKEGLVETTYLMVAAETGWHNLIIFLLFLCSFLFRCMVLIKKFWRKNGSYIFIGMFMSLIGVYLESGLEWVLKQTPNFYQMMLIFALIAVFYKKNIKLKYME